MATIEQVDKKKVEQPFAFLKYDDVLAYMSSENRFQTELQDPATHTKVAYSER
jgi:hypothetical protein